jgi:hypothetical protein
MNRRAAGQLGPGGAGHTVHPPTRAPGRAMADAATPLSACTTGNQLGDRGRNSGVSGGVDMCPPRHRHTLLFVEGLEAKTPGGTET